MVSGNATFTLDGETFDAPAGTIVHVPDPAVKRGAVGTRGTTILAVGAKPGVAFTPSPWERTAEALRFWQTEEWDKAIAILEEHLAETPDSGVTVYNLACALARAGRRGRGARASAARRSTHGGPLPRAGADGRRPRVDPRRAVLPRGRSRRTAMPGLDVTRAQIVAFRRRTGALDERLPAGRLLARAGRPAGLQDSVPRSALHSLHARVEGTSPDAWEDPSLVQVWGLRYTTYVVPAGDHAPFTLGRLPEAGRTRRRAEDLAAQLHAHLDGRRLDAGEAGDALGVNPNALRYAAMTGTVLIRWDGARQPTVWTVPRPEVDPPDARIELARRYLHALGPGTAGELCRLGRHQLARGARRVRRARPLARPGAHPDRRRVRPRLRRGAPSRARRRLRPRHDCFRAATSSTCSRAPTVSSSSRIPTQRASLWTSRVWPGAVLVDGDVAGTWRRAGALVTVQPWRRLSREERAAVEAEAATLPLPEVHGEVDVRWEAG